MKHFAKYILAFSLIAFASSFAQYKYTVGAIHKNVTFSSSNSYFLIGTLPAGSFY